MSDDQAPQRGFNKTFNSEEVARLKKLIEEGCQVQYEIDALKDGLNDTIKAIAEEMDIKSGILKKAIAVAHKANFDEEFEKFDALETILDVVGKKL